MNQTVTLFLLFSGELTAAERLTVTSYAARESIVLAEPRAARRPSYPVYPSELAEHIEAWLDEAQTLAASLDEERALLLLAAVERELSSHPELPQAAWLMAERHRIAASIRNRLPDGAADAALLGLAARALEGERAAPFGELVDAARGPEPQPVVALRVEDLDPADALELDGTLGPFERGVRPGRHHARVLRGSSLVWAGWIDVSAGASDARKLGVPPRVACSDDDLAEVVTGAARPSVLPGVRCQRWLALRRHGRGLELSRCERDRCGAFEPLAPERTLPKVSAGVPLWATAALVGAGALAAGSLILLGSGAFEREQPPATTSWVYRGVR